MPNDSPAGWKLVPVEPTDKMLERACMAINNEVAYHLMLAAAPEPPAAPPDAERVRLLEEALRDVLDLIGDDRDRVLLDRESVPLPILVENIRRILRASARAHG